MAVGRNTAKSTPFEAALLLAAHQHQGLLHKAGRHLWPGIWAGGALEAAASQPRLPPAAAPPPPLPQAAPKGAAGAASAHKAAATAAGPPSASHAAAGAALFGCLVFVAGAAPWLLLHAFLLFAATALPWRVFYYTRVQPWNRMYLLDFCYAVALATAAFLCLPPATRDPRLEAAVYALADGPVSGALVAWQCAWVFHSADHSVGVLLHLLPGLAMAVHHHLPRQHAASWGAPAASPSPTIPHVGSWPGAAPHHLSVACSSGANATAASGQSFHLAVGSRLPALTGAWDSALWMLAAPLAFYLAWQAAYWLVVQVLGRHYVCRHKLDTSYRCLTRRAQRANNIWAKLVLRGSLRRRLLLYGLLQLAFTVATLLLFIPTYHSPHLAFTWQAIKFMVPVYFGCKYQCERLYKAAMAAGVRQHLLEAEAHRGAATVHASQQQQQRGQQQQQQRSRRATCQCLKRSAS